MKMKDDDYKVREVSNGYVVVTCADNSETIFTTAKQMGKWFADKEPETEPEVIPPSEAKGNKSAA